MTSIRKSAIIACEKSFGSGKESTTTGEGNEKYKWHQLPPGAYISFTVSRQATSLYETGSKLRAGTAYGALSTQWTISFIMDYDHLELLDLFFDKSEVVSTTSTPTGCTDHKFTIANNAKKKSFCMRVKQRNRSVGGNCNEITTLTGMICRSISMSRSAGGSQMNVSIDGYAQKPSVQPNTSDDFETDWSKSDIVGGLTEYSCMFINGYDSDTKRVGEVEQHAFTIDNELSMVYNTCTPIPTAFAEGVSRFQWNASTYDNDPHKFKLLPFSGGKDASKFGTHADWALEPMTKGLGPAEKVEFITFSGTVNESGSGTTKFQTAINNSDYFIDVHAINSTIKSMTWQKGDGQKMMQNLSSIECDAIEITVRNKNSGIWNISSHYAAEDAPTVSS